MGKRGLEHYIRHKTGNKPIRCIPRTRVLSALEGQYSSKGNSAGVWDVLLSFPYIYTLILSRFPNIGDPSQADNLLELTNNRLPNGKRLARWLALEGVPEDVVQTFIYRLSRHKGCTFTLTVRHKDIIRMADTAHFESCYTRTDEDWYWQVIRYLANRDIGLVYIRDSKGDFSSRSIIRLLKLITPDSMELVIGVNKVYGNGLTLHAIADGLSRKIVAFKLLEKDEDKADSITLESFSRDVTGRAHSVVYEDADTITITDQKLGNAAVYYGRQIIPDARSNNIFRRSGDK